MATTRARAQREQIRRAHVGGFTLTEGRHPAGSALAWHSHETPTICYVLEGAFTEVSAGASVTCTPATLKFMPAGEVHADQFDLGGARGLLVEIEAGRAEMLRPHAGVLGERIHYHGGTAAAIAQRLHAELVHMDDAALLVIEGLVLELIATASRATPKLPGGRGPRWLMEAEEMIDAGLGGHLGLAGVAQSIGVHPVTLARTFRRIHGCSVGEFVRRRRIERALEALRHSGDSISAIALASGFADQSHFSNVFRRYVGLTPGRYRAAAEE
jgi:AraC family transcriptional regulator